MRIYGSIHTKFWTHPDVQKLSDQAKLFAIYLLSSSHTNMLGCFRIPIGYISEDLKWDPEIVAKILDELSQINYLTYDQANNWVFIHNFLKYNPIENPNQGRSIEKLFDEIPRNSKFIQQLIDSILKHNKFIQENFHRILKTLSEQFSNQNQNKDQEQNQKVTMSENHDIDALFINEINIENIQSSFQSTKVILKSQALEVLNFLNEKTGRVYRPVDTNLKLIMARLKSGATLAQCFQVIAKKTREWKSDAKMSEYLRPATLFNAVKFEQYVGELVVVKIEEKGNECKKTMS